jgi:hypothetical protein
MNNHNVRLAPTGKSGTCQNPVKYIRYINNRKQRVIPDTPCHAERDIYYPLADTYAGTDKVVRNGGQYYNCVSG